MINEYRRFSLIAISWILAVFAVYGQTTFEVSGRVMFESEPLIGAQIADANSSRVLGITDSIGYFNVSSATKELVVSFMGMDDVEFEWKGSPVTVQMSESSGLLNRVVISENKRETAIKNATVSLEIIQPEIIANTASPNIEDALGRLNGVQVVDNQPNIRSGGGWSYGAGSRVQVLVNNIPILSGDAGQPLWSFVPTEGVENIEVIKGAASVIYGSSALNGVINIKTQNPGVKPQSKISVTTGFYDLPRRESLRYNNKRNTISNLSVYHSTKIKSSGFSLGINALDDNGYKMSDHDKRIRTTLGYRKALPNKNAVFGVNSSIQTGNSSSFLLWDSYEKGYTALDSGITRTQTLRVTVDPYVNWRTGKLKHFFNSRYLRVSNSVDNGDSLNDQSNFSNWFYGEYRNQFSAFKDRLNLLSGVVASNTSTQSPLFNGSQTMLNLAGYIQADLKYRHLLFMGGVRYEHFKLNDRVDGKPVLRLGLNWELTDYTFLRASFGQGYRFPSIAESFISTTVGPVTVFPNDSLSAESGNNIEVGLKQGFKLGSVNFLADVAVYRMTLVDMMEFTFSQWGAIAPPLFGLGFKTVNTGKAQITGTEFTLAFEHKLQKKQSLQGFVGYNYSHPIALQPDLVYGVDNGGLEQTYTRTSLNASNSILKYRPQHLFKGDIMLNINNINLGIGATYQSQMQNIDTAFVGPISLFVPGMETSYNLKQTQYFIVNLRAGYSFDFGLKVNFIISNIANTEFAYRPADLGPPRSARVQIAYNIK